MNEEEEEDFESRFVDSDGDVGEDEVAYAYVSNRVVQNLKGLYGYWGTHSSENEADGEGSYSFHSVHGSGNDGPTWPEFNTDCDMENPKFKVGLVFSNKAILKEAIKQYGWKIDADSDTFSITTFNDVHTCAKVMKNTNITSKLITKTYLHKFQTHINYAPSSLKADVEADYVAILNGNKCLSARKLTLEMIDGSYKDRFKSCMST
ncbi:hypothetical protein V6N13_042899 [Hibiscus sabdariffa]